MARYDLSDSQWEQIRDELPGKPGDRGVTAADNRLFVNAVLWVLRSGAYWKDLPERYGNWKRSTNGSLDGRKRASGSGFSRFYWRTRTANAG